MLRNEYTLNVVKKDSAASKYLFSIILLELADINEIYDNNDFKSKTSINLFPVVIITYN